MRRPSSPVAESAPVQKPATYCTYVLALAGQDGNVHKLYHDRQYGFPLRDDNELFCRLILEINQAGLSWTTILKKEEGFRSAYEDFDIRRVAAYSERDMNRLLGDERIIRNRLKVRAAVENARRIISLANEHGSFKAWLDHHHPQSIESWTSLFKSAFTFTGSEIVKEFLVSTGYLPGAHGKRCRVYAEILNMKPPWSLAHPSVKPRAKR